IPFLASVVLLLIGLFVRLRVSESPVFQDMKTSGKKDRFPVKTVLTRHLPDLLPVVGARVGEVTWFYTIATFSLAYATGTLGLSENMVLHAVMWGAALAFVGIPFAGFLGDRIGNRLIFMAGALGVILFSAPF